MTVSASQLHVVSCIYNPLRWSTRIAHARTWVQHMLDTGIEKLTLIECALGERNHELSDLASDPRVEHIAVRANSLAWNKECLVNLAIHRSKFRTPYIAWIDADVIFTKKDWALETVHALQLYDVVQPWSSALDLGPDGEPMMIKGVHVQTAFARVWQELGDIKPFSPGKEAAVAAAYEAAPGMAYPHPGYAWAIRRDTLNAIGGLVDVSGLGAGDHQMAMSFVGKIDNAIHGQTHGNYQQAIRAWGENAYRRVGGNLGYVTGKVEHLFHGAKSKRKYHERWSVLVDHAFDPVTDIRRNLDGVVELVGNKPAMRHAFDLYFRQRDEDANVLCE